MGIVQWSFSLQRPRNRSWQVRLKHYSCFTHLWGHASFNRKTKLSAPSFRHYVDKHSWVLHIWREKGAGSIVGPISAEGQSVTQMVKHNLQVIIPKVSWSDILISCKIAHFQLSGRSNNTKILLAMACRECRYKNCPDCAVKKSSNWKWKASLQEIVTRYLMQMLAVNITGPFLWGENGNVYRFTIWLKHTPYQIRRLLHWLIS